MGPEKDMLIVCTLVVVLFAIIVLCITQIDLEERRIEVRDNVLNRSSIIVVPDNKGNIMVEVERAQTVIRKGID